MASLPDAGSAPTRRRLGPLVLYDGHCPLCLRSVRWLRAADSSRRLTFRPAQEMARDPVPGVAGVGQEALLRQIHVVFPDGSVLTGFRAFRRLLRWLPPLWPLLPVCHLPGASVVGNWIYTRVAAGRGRTACDAACATRSPR